MKHILFILLLLKGLSAFGATNASFFELDLFNPFLRALESTQLEEYDLRLGHRNKGWEYSLRFLTRNGQGYTGGSAGAGIEISDASDTYYSLRVAHLFGKMGLGAGAGHYSREYYTNVNSDKRDFRDSSFAAEFFANYLWNFGSLYVRPELNYILANLDSKESNSDGFNSYNIKYSEPEVRFLVLIGLRF